MERTSNSCTPSLLVTLFILLLLPARSLCKEDTYKSLTEARPECCVRGDAGLKRFGDIDYDSFVSLMGRRSAAQTNSHRNTHASGQRRLDHVLADLLERRARMACPCAEEYLQTRRGRFITPEKPRFQRFL